MSISDLKQQLRRVAYDARHAQADKDRHSRMAVTRLMKLPEYSAAKTAMWYLDCRSELRTRETVAAEIESASKRIVVPFCEVDDQGVACLGLWHLTSMEELSVGKWNILEPSSAVRARSHRSLMPHNLDVVVVPGVAFDRTGLRLGNGQGYYDRLLAKITPNCAIIGICFECQLRDDLVADRHDVPMHAVVTETNVYRG